MVRAADDELQVCPGARSNVPAWQYRDVERSDDGPRQLRLLDFEDVMFGDPVLDVAITLYYGRERPDHAALSEAYESGYRSVREWPVRDTRQMDLLVAARAVMLLNHALQTELTKGNSGPFAAPYPSCCELTHALLAISVG